VRIITFNLKFYRLNHVDPTRPDPWVGSRLVQLWTELRLPRPR